MYVQKYLKYNSKIKHFNKNYNLAGGASKILNYIIVWLGESMPKECDNSDTVHCRNKIIKNIITASKTLPVNCHVFCDSDSFFEQLKSDSLQRFGF